VFSNSNRAGERAPIQKAEGVTPSERYLKSLCDKSFLSLWSYPSLSISKKNNGNGDGKELCDMLVVFDKHILIFSDKHCLFPTSDKLDLDWKRWYKRAIKKSADQVWGAQRWLISYPKKVYLDRQCTKLFPLNIPPSEVAQYHLIAIANGSERRCTKEFNGSGSLMLDSSLGSHGNTARDSNPFTVGDLNPTQTFVHVLTESTLDFMLKTLDTIVDFISYLEKKESLFRSKIQVFAPGEEDLLAYYLMSLNAQGAHDFPAKVDNDAIVLAEGFWKNFCTRPERKDQLQQNEISYLWDNLIQRFSQQALNSTQYYTNHTELTNTEIGLRLMASEPRTVRRLIAKGLFDLFANTPDGTKRTKCLKPISPYGTYYVFLCLPQPGFASYDEYREVRGRLIEASCLVVKYKFPEALDIVGIASNPQRPNQGSSEDLYYLDAREWSDEKNNEAARLQQDLGILTETNFIHIKENEYPDVEI
jgi:hypothetical protein